MSKESDETEIERWESPAVISEIAQEHVDMWNGYKEAQREVLAGSAELKAQPSSEAARKEAAVT
jgi:hypothetical protein